MDRIAEYREIIQKVLTEYTRIPYSYGDLICESIFDTQQDRYVLMTVGWNQQKRFHGCLVHIDIRDGYIWIQRDGTEDGIATELVAAGVPKSQIVLGFQAPELRQHTEWAHAG